MKWFELVEVGMKNIKNEIKELALFHGSDLVGITSVDRLEGAPEGHKPEDILPNAKSVVVCAKRIPNTVVMGGPATSYHNMMRLLETQLDFIAYAIAIFAERQGGLAIPVSSDRPYYDWDPETFHGRGDLSHKHAAQAAGLGRLGKNSMLITREFGNRVQLVSVVTNLELEPDPIFKNELCPAECVICIKSCPVNAIANDQQVNQRLCRSHMYVQLPKGSIIESCRECRKVCPIGVE